LSRVFGYVLALVVGEVALAVDDAVEGAREVHRNGHARLVALHVQAFDHGHVHHHHRIRSQCHRNKEEHESKNSHFVNHLIGT